jgi:glycosyltransferase involved in cell wall biosynthesis
VFWIRGFHEQKARLYLRTKSFSELSLLIFVFVTALVVQLVFFVLLFAGVTRKNPPTTSGKPAVSLLVCAHDSEKNLKALIPRLLEQDYPLFELVIVDDRSNDGTYDYLLEVARKDNRVRVVKVAHLPDHVNAKKYAITLGIKAATYDWILLTDADCQPNSNHWIDSMSQYMDDNARFVLGISPYEKHAGLLNLFIRFETLFTAVQYVGFARIGMAYMGVGRNLAYRKSYFLANKGFNSLMNFTGGDDDLYVNRHATAETTRVCLGMDSLVYSKPKHSVNEFFTQKKRHLFAGKKYRSMHKLVLSLFIGTHLFTWVSGIILLGIAYEPVLVAAFLVFRTGLFALLIHKARRCFGCPFETFAVPFLDFLFVFYYLSTAPAALISKRVKWTS